MAAAAEPTISTNKVAGKVGSYDVAVTKVEPSGDGDVDSVVVLCHGLGDTAMGWLDVAAGYYAKALPTTRFLLPTAPSQPVTLNMGMVMPSWYDLRGLGERDDEDCDGIDDSKVFLETLVEEQIAAGIPASRIVLAGFSQGGALSLYTGLQSDHTFAGILCKSGYLPRRTAVGAAVTSAAKETPIQLLHGDADPMVVPKWAQMTYDTVVELGFTSDIKWYKGLEHGANLEEIADAITFLKKVLAGNETEGKEAET